MFFEQSQPVKKWLAQRGDYLPWFFGFIPYKSQ
jgi:hypothetical protein